MRPGLPRRRSAADGAAARAGGAARTPGTARGSRTPRGEEFADALVIVGLLAVPGLLRINGAHRGFAPPILCAVYSFGIDADGKVREKRMRRHG